MVISNSSPLIHLIRLGKIEYLFNLVDNISIPKAVFNELVIKGKEKNYSEAYSVETFIKEKKINVINLKPFNDSFYPPLGRAELEALELAKQNNELLLIDEKKVRNFAKIIKVEHQTTLATIFELLISEKIDISDFKLNIKRYAENSWISADIIQEYYEKGEKFGR
jgi:predicted nucleic acid-binding protein